MPGPPARYPIATFSVAAILFGIAESPIATFLAPVPISERTSYPIPTLPCIAGLAAPASPVPVPPCPKYIELPVMNIGGKSLPFILT